MSQLQPIIKYTEWLRSQTELLGLGQDRHRLDMLDYQVVVIGAR